MTVYLGGWADSYDWSRVSYSLRWEIATATADVDADSDEVKNISRQ